MSTAVADPGGRARTAGAAPSAADSGPAPRWVLGGAASEIADRLGARVGFVRLVLVLASWAQFWPVLGVYAAATLLVPHGRRTRPDWCNLMGLARIAMLLGVAFGIGVGDFGQGGLFSQGPQAWIPAGAVIVAAWLVLLAGRRRDAVPAADRRSVLSALPGLGLAAAVTAVAALAPGARAELVLDGGQIAAGVLVAIAGPRIDTGAAAVPLVALGLLAVLLGFSGAGLEGGIGDLAVTVHRPGAGVATYRRAIGTIELDLSHVPVGSPAPVRARVALGIGRVTITVPQDAVGSVTVRVGSGQIDAEQFRNGVGLARTIRLPVYGGWHGARGPRIELAASVGRGTVTITTPNGGG
jgi:hypothetical protein